MKTYSKLAWIALCAALTAVVVWHCSFSAPDHDEIEHLHAAWRMAHGDRPFVDFLEQHHPVLWYLLVPVVDAFSVTQRLVFAVRLDLALLVATLAVVARLLRRLYPGIQSRWSVLLLAASMTFVRNMLEVRPDPLMNFLLYAGLAAWVEFLDEPRGSRALVAGLLLGGAIVVLQKALVPIGLAFAATGLLFFLRPRRGHGHGQGHGQGRISTGTLIAGVALAGGAAVVPMALLAATMWREGLWSEFWFWNYPFNRYFYLQAHLARHFSTLNTLWPSMLEAPLLWAAGLAGAALRVAALWRQRRELRTIPGAPAHVVLLTVLAGYMVFLLLNRFPLEQYWIVLLPLLSVYSGELFVRLQKGWPALLLRGASVATVTFLVLRLVQHQDASQFEKVQEFVLGHTRPDETIFVPPEFNPVFRKDSAYFWYNGTLIRKTYMEYCKTHECVDRKDLADDRAWEGRPPAYVYLCPDEEYHHLRWLERAPGFVPTELPSLMERKDRAALRRR